MTWIKEAEREGIDISERHRLDLEHFYSEKVTEEAVRELLNRHIKPVVPLIEDLKNTGYIVRKSGPGFLPSQYEKDNPFVREVSLSRLAPIKSVEYYHRNVELFGVEWEISKATSSGNKKLGTITIHPIVNERTHYGGVSYMAVSEQGSLTVLKSHLEETPVDGMINRNLQRTIGDWITKTAK